jgi:hypothetical protein
MKHIKKRFIIQMPTSEFDEIHKKDGYVFVSKESVQSDIKIKNGSLAYINTDEDLTIGGFSHKVNGKDFVFPVPDPTLIYFNNAQSYIKIIDESKNNLIDKIDFRSEFTETGLNEIYNFYGSTSGFVIFLFTAIESFVNQLIPEEYNFRKKLKNRTELYTKTQIEQNIDFKTKLNKILPDATGKDFFKSSTQAVQRIWNLKDFRDAIIHTKSSKSHVQFDHLIKTSLNFKYSDTLSAVAKFMNHYKSDYIVECDCGAQ